MGSINAWLKLRNRVASVEGEKLGLLTRLLDEIKSLMEVADIEYVKKLNRCLEALGVGNDYRFDLDALAIKGKDLEIKPKEQEEEKVIIKVTCSSPICYNKFKVVQEGEAKCPECNFEFDIDSTGYRIFNEKYRNSLFSQLKNSLSSQNWGGADEITKEILYYSYELYADSSYMAYRRHRLNASLALLMQPDKLREKAVSDLLAIRCNDFKMLDELWVKYSNSRFGFSVQKRIWQEVGKSHIFFGDRVRWRIDGKWLFCNYSLEAPQGNLPFAIWKKGWNSTRNDLEIQDCGWLDWFNKVMADIESFNL